MFVPFVDSIFTKVCLFGIFVPHADNGFSIHASLSLFEISITPYAMTRIVGCFMQSCLRVMMNNCWEEYVPSKFDSQERKTVGLFLAHAQELFWTGCFDILLVCVIKLVVELKKEGIFG